MAIDDLIPERAVTVYEEDLDVVLDTLTTVYHFCVTQDLTRQYASLRNQVDLSPLTRAVDAQRRKLKGILDDWRADQEDVPAEQPISQD